MICDKRYSDGSKCGKKAYGDNRCFPHYRRTVPRSYLKALDRDLERELVFGTFVHACPASGTCWLHIRRPNQTDLQPNVTIDEPFEDTSTRAFVAPIGQDVDPWDALPIDLDRVEKRYPKGWVEKVLSRLDPQES